MRIMLVLDNILTIALGSRISTQLINGGLGVLIIVAAIILGLLLRRLLVRRLKKTVLDTWLIQTFGVIVALLPSILGLIGALAIWNTGIITYLISDSHDVTIPGLGSLATLVSRLIQTLLIGTIGYGIARTIQKTTVHGISIGNNRIDINMRTLFGRTLYFTTLAIAGFFILSAWDIPVGVPVAVLGAFTVTITVAFQDILKNLVAGIYILVERPFYIGDQIQISLPGTPVYVGRVEDVRLRATTIRLRSGEEASIPNIIIFGNIISNNTHFGERRSIVVITMLSEDFHRDEFTSKILKVVKEDIAVIEKPEPVVMVSGYTEGKITIEVRFWVQTGLIIDISELLYKIHELIPDANISVKEPI